jgi:hypothetical protein
VTPAGGGGGGGAPRGGGGGAGPPHLAPRGAPDVQLRGILVRGEEHVVAHIEYGRDLESRRRDGLAVEGDTAGVLRSVDEHESAVAQPIRHTGDDRLPMHGEVLEERLCLPGVRVGLEDDPALLVA